MINTILIIAGVVLVLLLMTLGVKRAMRWLFSIDEIIEKLDEIKKEVE